MKRLLLSLSLIFLSFSGLSASESVQLAENDAVIIYTTADPYDQVIKREVRELNRFRKLTDRYLRHRERGQRVSARQTLRRLSALIRSEVDQTRNKYRYEIRFSGEIRSGAELYRKKRPGENLRRRSYRRNSGSQKLDLYRNQLIRQRNLQNNINELIRSGYYLDAMLAENILSFEQTLSDEVQLLKGNFSRSSYRR